MRTRRTPASRKKRIEDNDGRATISNADLMAELGLTEEDIAGTPIPEMA